MQVEVDTPQAVAFFCFGMKGTEAYRKALEEANISIPVLMPQDFSTDGV